MKEANFKNSDKYFHARGNYDAARRGPGGAWAARVIRYLGLPGRAGLGEQSLTALGSQETGFMVEKPLGTGPSLSCPHFLSGFTVGLDVCWQCVIPILLSGAVHPALEGVLELSSAFRN